MSVHEFEKTEAGHYCCKCDRTWKNKPRDKFCPEAKYIKVKQSDLENWRNYPEIYKRYWLEDSLREKNLKPIDIAVSYTHLTLPTIYSV